MNVTTLMNKITGKTLTRADLDESNRGLAESYLVIAFPYIDSEMVGKVQSWAVANKYKNIDQWSVSAGVTGELAILSMTLEHDF